jgi:hypothetical protein
MKIAETLTQYRETLETPIFTGINPDSIISIIIIIFLTL